MSLLSRSDILKATVTPRETVHVKELGGDVIVRGMTGVERDVFEASCIEGRGKTSRFNMRNFRAKLVANCCVDEQGNRIFTDADVATLGEVRADVIDRLFGVAQRLSGMRDEDLDELGLASEKTALSGTPSSASPSG
jgi:hypothetical protein